VAAIALGFGAALFWGLADFLGGLRTRRLTLGLVLLVSQLCGLAAIAVVVAAGNLEIPPGGDLAPAVIAGICQLAGIAALYRALAIGTMSVISPISASGAAALPVIVGVAAGERPGALQVAGMAAAFAGVALATRTDGDEAGGGSPRQALALSAIAALGFGGFYVGMDAAADSADPLGALLIARAAAGAALVTLLVVVRPRLGGEASDLPALALIGLLDVGANACFALGTEAGLLSVVAVLASLYPVGTVVLARALLGERLAAIQAIGITIALAGVALIAAG
jgi:drug/metabolite transporter (DMT)-like permease